MRQNEYEKMVNDFNGLMSERNQLKTILEEIDKLTCNCPCMSLQAQHEFERCKEAEAYKIELAKVVIAIRELARNGLTLKNENIGTPTTGKSTARVSIKNQKPNMQTKIAPLDQSTCSESLAPFTGFKFEHILISVTIAHNRSIGQFDDSCAYQISKGMKEYQGILMVDTSVQYKHCSEEQHPENCECGLCDKVRREM